MNTLPYPGGAARAIAQARASGMRPADTVLIVLSGSYDWPNPMVYAQPNQRYRWDWLKGLSVAVLIEADTRLGTILDDIEAGGTTQVNVLDTERRIGWLVNATRPKLKTIQMPRAWVEDWLGSGTWHAELQRIKDEAKQRAEQQKQAQALRDLQNIEYDRALEAIWN